MREPTSMDAFMKESTERAGGATEQVRLYIELIRTLLAPLRTCLKYSRRQKKDNNKNNNTKTKQPQTLRTGAPLQNPYFTQAAWKKPRRAGRIVAGR